MSSFPSIHGDPGSIQLPSEYALGKKEAAVDIKTYLLKVTRNNAAVAMAFNMPRGKEITYAVIIALISTMTT